MAAKKKAKARAKRAAKELPPAKAKHVVFTTDQADEYIVVELGNMTEPALGTTLTTEALGALLNDPEVSVTVRVK